MKSKLIIMCALVLVMASYHCLSVNGNYKDPGKADAIQLAVKFGLPKDEAEEVFEEIQKRSL